MPTMTKTNGKKSAAASGNGMSSGISKVADAVQSAYSA